MNNAEKILCPSARAVTGSQLLGVRQPDGTVAILPQALPVTQQFIDKATLNNKDPQQYFRFANKCVEHGCKQWTGSRCGVADRIVEEIKSLINFSEANLPHVPSAVNAAGIVNGIIKPVLHAHMLLRK